MHRETLTRDLDQSEANFAQGERRIADQQERIGTLTSLGSDIALASWRPPIQFYIHWVDTSTYGASEANLTSATLAVHWNLSS
jgi:hypothetical protein